MMKKIFEISELKITLKNKYFEREGISDYEDRETLYDDGRANGVEEFLDFVEDEYNKEHA